MLPQTNALPPQMKSARTFLIYLHSPLHAVLSSLESAESSGTFLTLLNGKRSRRPGRHSPIQVMSDL